MAAVAAHCGGVAAHRPMDGGFRAAHAQLAGRARRFRDGGGIARTERVSGGDGGDVMCEERGLRRATQAEHGEAMMTRVPRSRPT